MLKQIFIYGAAQVFVLTLMFYLLSPIDAIYRRKIRHTQRCTLGSPAGLSATDAQQRFF